MFVHISAVECAGMSPSMRGQKVGYDVVSEAASSRRRFRRPSDQGGFPISSLGGSPRTRRHDVGVSASLAAVRSMVLRSVEIWDRSESASEGKIMARKPATRAEFELFDVFYVDGSQRSNRRVPREILGGLDREDRMRAVIEEQDRLIAEKSGKPALTIKSIRRSGRK